MSQLISNPTHDTLWEIIQSTQKLENTLHSAREREKHLVSELGVVRRQIASMETQLSSLEHAISNLQGPAKMQVFNSLDLMSQVFFYATYGENERFTISAEATNFRLSSVCHGWRDIALRCPRIWNSFRVSYVEFGQTKYHRLRLCLTRSIPLTLNIELCDVPEGGWGELRRFLHPLLMHKDRWRRISIPVPEGGNCNEVFPIRHLPNLEHLELEPELYPPLPVLEHLELLHDAPSLRSLSLLDLDLNAFLPNPHFPWTQIRYLNILETETRLVLPAQLFQQCPELTHLSILASEVVFSDTRSQVVSKLIHVYLQAPILENLVAWIHPHLRSFRFWYFDFQSSHDDLKLFLHQHPTLTTLRLDLVPSDLDPDSDPNPGPDLSELSSPTLTTLFVHSIYWEGDRSNSFLSSDHLVTNFPALKRLEVDTGDGEEVGNVLLQRVLALDPYLSEGKSLSGLKQVVLGVHPKQLTGIAECAKLVEVRQSPLEWVKRERLELVDG